MLLWNETARVVDPSDYQTYTWEDWATFHPRDDEAFIQAVRMRLRAPEVITLVTCDRVPRTTVTFSRRNLFRRDRWACQYCGKKPDSDSLTIDHGHPSLQGEARRDGTIACWLVPSAIAGRRTAHRPKPRCDSDTLPRPRAGAPCFAVQDVRIESWSKFISEVYWNVELED